MEVKKEVHIPEEDRRSGVASIFDDGLIIVGNPMILSLDPLWRALINYIHVNGGYKGPRLDWDTRAPVNFVDEGIYARSRTQQAASRMDNLERRIRGVVMASAGNEEEFLEEEDEVVYESRVSWRDNV